MKRLHVHIGVTDLDQAITFYSGLFGSAPTRREADYAKWLLDDPKVNFAVSLGHEGLSHLGLQVDADAKPQNSQSGKSDGGGEKSGSESSNAQTGKPSGAAQSGNAQGDGEQGPDMATGDEANLEYARKATDLVLEYLKDQEQQADPELLKKLGWKQNDVDKFLKRWAQMKQNAQGADPAGQQGKTKLDELLKGMGLQAPTAEVRRGADRNDTQRDNRNTGRKRKVPANLLDPFRAFQRGLQQQP